MLVYVRVYDVVEGPQFTADIDGAWHRHLGHHRAHQRGPDEITDGVGALRTEPVGDVPAEAGERGEQLEKMLLVDIGPPGPRCDEDLQSGNRCRAQERVGDRV